MQQPTTLNSVPQQQQQQQQQQQGQGMIAGNRVSKIPQNYGAPPISSSSSSVASKTNTATTSSSKSSRASSSSSNKNAKYNKLCGKVIEEVYGKINEKVSYTLYCTIHYSY
jgi:hypothetical protein